MKLKSILPAIALFLATCFAYSCSSDDILSTDENVPIEIATMKSVDSIEDFQAKYDSIRTTRYATILDSATFYKLYGKYMTTKDTVFAEAYMDAPPSRSASRPTIEVISRKKGDWYTVTITKDRLKVVYDTKNRFEFPFALGNPNDIFKVSYEPEANQFLGASHVLCPNQSTLTVAVDLFNQVGEHVYDQTSAGMTIKIAGEKFYLNDYW